MAEHKWNLATHSWHKHDPANGLAVGVSVLRPNRKRYPQWATPYGPYPFLEGSRDLWPRSNWPKFQEWLGLGWPEPMRTAYLERLDARAARIEAFLDGLTQTYGATRLILLCHEPRPSDCHRQWLAQWLTERYDVPCHEIGHEPPPEPQAIQETLL